MSRLGNQSRRRGNAGRKVKFAALIAAPLALVGVGATVVSQYDPNTRLAANFCSHEVSYESAFFVEASFIAQTSRKQNRDLRQALQNAFAALPAKGRLSIFTTLEGDDKTLLSPVSSVCRPVSTLDEQSMAGGASKTAAQLNHDSKLANAYFGRSMDALIASATDPSKAAANSPIIETIKAISRYYRGNLDTFDLWTDGLQNSHQKQACQKVGHWMPYEVWKQSRQYQYMVPDRFDGTHVNFYLVEHIPLPNPALPYCTQLEIRDFYPAMFEDLGATVTPEYIRP